MDEQTYFAQRKFKNKIQTFIKFEFSIFKIYKSAVSSW